jgi:flagellum-specific ATP synthase
MDEPVSDTVRGILDGHIILSRNLAQRYHYPAIDVLASISRLANTVSGPETKKAGGIIRRLIADYAASEDLINIGAYKAGSNAKLDEAIAKRDEIEKFLVQAVEEKSTVPETLTELGEIAGLEIPDEEMEVYLPKMVFQTKEEEEPFEMPGVVIPAVLASPVTPIEALPEAKIETTDPPSISTFEDSADDLPLMDFD